MATFLGLRVKFKADTKQYRDAQNRLRTDTSKFAKNSEKQIKGGFRKGVAGAIKSLGQLKKSLLSAKNVVIGFVAAFAAKKTFDAFYASLARINELSLWSKTLNIGINDLQKLTFAFGRVGFAADKVTDVLKDVGEKVGDALIAGTGEFAGQIDELGISIDRFRGLNPAEVLVELAKATENLSAQKRITVFEAVANDASKLLPLLSNNSKQLNMLFKEWESFGTRFTQTQVENANAFKLNVGTMSALWDNFTSMLSAELAPAFEPLFKYVKDTIKEMGGMRKITAAIAKAAVDMGISFLNGLDTAQKAFRQFVLLAENSFRDFGNFVLSLIRNILSALDAIPLVDLSGPIKDLDKAAQRSFTSIQKNVQAMEDINKEGNIFASTIKSLTTFRDRIGTGPDANFAKKQTDFTRAATKAEKEKAEQLKKARDELLKKQQKENSELEKTRNLYEAITRQAQGLAEIESGGGLIKQLQGAAAKASSFVSTAEGERNRQLFQAGLNFLKTGGQGATGGAGELKINITTDDKGVIKPVVESKQLSDKVTVIVNNEIAKQATINSR